ncbi:hypothetical protein A3C91_02560 [Candidatus Azambacteria bacterium RIFCSPHIGHO2_02_FULL_52_12]|uniref:Carboxypeptidase regulatory-like domain-containing protein n=1 Tax=Candidatus Azambacteria bacterium RIFCSPLOWO2_01_FULL_46_25 TaxID=1797298 RepID=A0A1F5BVS7_9BACT|nr:MAG: hypothetical protein A3C91_02560 [Candidatus Azambacteria bacterium RIFCSPHIGHO2_02_FULL_52_12]OGD34700.1 MAG: hypothetical protein A2988_04355 [Candidatus Azambacteria bacterium RIFCSPLOWO2_01_FULL_46_25]OGD37470.1 MAG: hypothetical protein A2850_02785 [Candidatus Azambacteria bacterium RIFCSPHIGHO2_01_FULL_51_74]
MTTFTKNAIIGGYFLFLALAVVYVIQESSRLEKGYRAIGNEIACTMEAKLCPDGSAVGRVGSSCEFAPCPGTQDGASAGEGVFRPDDPVGRVSGRVSIRPLCPVEPCRGGMMQNPYIGREIVLRSQDGRVFAAALDDEGNFKLNAPAGAYTMNLSNCVFMGCAYALPKNITLEAGKTTRMDIDIDTGIR